jgi:hypothetical protein
MSELNKLKEMATHIVNLAELVPGEATTGSEIAAMGWNACRARMLRNIEGLNDKRPHRDAEEIESVYQVQLDDDQWIDVSESVLFSQSKHGVKTRVLFTAAQPSALPPTVMKPIDLSECRTLWYEHDELSSEVECIPVMDIKKAIRAAGYQVEGE